MLKYGSGGRAAQTLSEYCVTLAMVRTSGSSVLLHLEDGRERGERQHLHLTAELDRDWVVMVPDR